ncbi:MAG: polyprenyl synthetase family protein [Holophagaceae bacterium]|nr:polyprenyl synthetase family protein [Holophagaceae bacterium]
MTEAALSVRRDLERLLPLVEARLLGPFRDGEAERLAEAMRYSLSAGGKRVRPVLCLLAAEAVGGDAESALPGALALEFIHTYSLVHDDLPAMDDDDLRRGKPTCHIAFDEAHAILAGDGLLTEAFRILAAEGAIAPERRVRALETLAVAAGWRGMVGGQALDLEGETLTREGRDLGLEHLQTIHRLKTGALLRAALELGGILGGAEGSRLDALRGAGAALGLAFQIQDDILDATSDASTLGKRAGKDSGKGKITYPALLGLDGARKALQEATERAVCLLQSLPNPSSLQAWARYLETREA